MPPVVGDTSSLIALERVGQLALLPAVFPDVIAPPEVVEEFGEKPEWLTLREVADHGLTRSLQAQLDDGEAEALALAVEQEARAVLVDEKKARRVAREQGLRAIGTLGLLLRAKQQALIADVKPIMDALIAADFRIAERLYQDVLRRAGEGGH